MKNIHTSAYLIASEYHRLPAKIRGLFSALKVMPLPLWYIGNWKISLKKIPNSNKYLEFYVRCNFSLIQQRRIPHTYICMSIFATRVCTTYCHNTQIPEIKMGKLNLSLFNEIQILNEN